MILKFHFPYLDNMKGGGGNDDYMKGGGGGGGGGGGHRFPGSPWFVPQATGHGEGRTLCFLILFSIAYSLHE